MSVTAGPAASEHEGQAWLLRVLLGWHASYALMAVGLDALLWSGGAPWAMHLVLYLLVGCYLRLGVPALASDLQTRGGLVFLALAYAGLLVLGTADDRTAILLYLLIPTTFALLASIGAAIGLALGATVLSDLLYLSRHGWEASSTGQLVLQNTSVWLFALLVGFFVTQLVVENRRQRDLIGELNESRALLTSAYHEAGVLSERARMSQEIHDTITQGLTSTLMLIRAAHAAAGSDPDRVRERLELAQQTVKENLAEARAVVGAADPVHLRSTPLDTAIKNITARLGEELDITAEATVSGRPLPLDATVQVVLLRCAQEALANVRKHAEARHVRVDLRYHPRSAVLEVSDDGRGFVVDEARGFGLPGMRARVGQANGMVNVVSRPGAGTTVTVEIAWTGGEARR